MPSLSQRERERAKFYVKSVALVLEGGHEIINCFKGGATYRSLGTSMLYELPYHVFLILSSNHVSFCLMKLHLWSVNLLQIDMICKVWAVDGGAYSTTRMQLITYSHSSHLLSHFGVTHL